MFVRVFAFVYVKRVRAHVYMYRWFPQANHHGEQFTIENNSFMGWHAFYSNAKLFVARKIKRSKMCSNFICVCWISQFIFFCRHCFPFMSFISSALFLHPIRFYQMHFNKLTYKCKLIQCHKSRIQHLLIMFLHGVCLCPNKDKKLLARTYTVAQ